MADKPTHEELEQRVKELEKETVEHKCAEEGLCGTVRKDTGSFLSVSEMPFLCRTQT